MMGGDAPYLPEEIIVNILKRLPVKFLVRFQCVCRSWKNYLKNPSFVDDHLRHSHQNSFLLFQCCGNCDPKRRCAPLHLCLVDRKIQVHRIQNAPQVPPKNGVRIIASSNGLLCVRVQQWSGNSINSLLVYNLAIREVKEVPIPLNYVADDQWPDQTPVGFGFSPIVNDYRIVKLRSSFLIHKVYGGEVFSIRTGSWRKIDVGNLKRIRILKGDGFTMNGAIFWFGIVKQGMTAERDKNVHQLIVSFEIAEEAFTLIPVPPICVNFCTNFTVYDNKLAVLCPVGNSQSCSVELWVMEENAGGHEEEEMVVERWSWTKKHTSDHYPFFLHPYTIWGNEIVCRVDAMSGPIREPESERDTIEIKTLLIDLATNEYNMFAQRHFSRHHHVFNHVESLVSVNYVTNEEEP